MIPSRQVIPLIYKTVLDYWKNLGIRSASDLDRHLGNFRILFAYHSGRIENSEITYHDTREIFENGRALHFTGDPRTLFELQNQKVCYDFLRERIAARLPLDIALVLETHRILTEGTYDERRYIENGERPGQFKKHDYITGLYEVGVAARNVEAEMRALLDEIAEYTGGEILKVGTYFHARFEYIHPFADGNGRTGRTLLNYLLMINGHPPLIVYDEDKALYYECLQTYDSREEIEPLHKFLTHETEKTWAKTLSLEANAFSPNRTFDITPPRGYCNCDKT